MFFISCAFLVITNVQYVIFASGKTQVWNNPNENKSIENGTDSNEKEEKSDKKTEDDRL